MLTESLIILALILLNGIFSASEIAIVSSRKARLQVLVDRKNAAAKQVLKLKDSPNQFLSTVQIGITLIGILTGIFGGATLAQRLDVYLSEITWMDGYSSQVSVLIVVIVITFLTLVLGELVPKRIGLAMPEKYATIIAFPMNILSRIVAPFVWLLSVTTEGIVRLLNIKTSQNAVTEEEIKALVDEGADTGAIEHIEHEIVDRVFSLGDKRAVNLMTHRSNIVWLDINDGYDIHKQIILKNGHTVYPVCQGGLDNVIGVVHIKSLLKQYLIAQPIQLEQLTHPLNYVHENSSAYSILNKFKTSKIHQAIVLDEYGALQGIVTINDILSSLVGDISDSDTAERPEIIRREDGSLLIDGQYQIDDLFTALNIDISEEEEVGLASINTIAGLVLLKLGHMPTAGERMQWKDHEFEVVDMDGNRIDKILVKFLGT
ncbi:hemolysin family protein [Parapedobacter indicus]|uniref:Putative hemolysin n=1 Tax=Parapedobacter indicus TaxID=1477437 RepID=A0A1I3J4F4_9SPHI|nr:hemolysin family protein [Parapedobacter indicus]PPL02393.1 putative hemolysin [Parapedobacter indicus]SFI55184.1 putative hemolysin [Parapedobacter indicus]